MEIQIDLESGVPIYVQLVDRIKQMVVTGQLQPGQQLPTIRQLAADLRINYNTVGRAYSILDEEGIISTQQGRGTYITRRLDEGQLRKLRLDKLRGMIGQAVQEARALGYEQQEIEAIFQEQLHAENS
ncbi:MAG: GntR family transcriptional regulator [Anaerolineaceae bacterium]|jgi:GntR family transcriptional regulator|nr:GntR family transcriptional regulator [Anaerolineae bacterium]MDX9832733.1 GntR family transcriptional regulator [Anaerolineae bacterium]NLF12017.1 GntR family transcriptional regulator [Anaerolineaceae bacterium]